MGRKGGTHKLCNSIHPLRMVNSFFLTTWMKLVVTVYTVKQVTEIKLLHFWRTIYSKLKLIIQLLHKMQVATLQLNTSSPQYQTWHCHHRETNYNSPRSVDTNTLNNVLTPKFQNYIKVMTLGSMLAT